jgi:hypothetical protein
MLRVAVMAALAYAGLILALRVAGKRALAKLNAFDLVVRVALGWTLATILLQSKLASPDRRQRVNPSLRTRLAGRWLHLPVAIGWQVGRAARHRTRLQPLNLALHLRFLAYLGVDDPVGKGAHPRVTDVRALADHDRNLVVGYHQEHDRRRRDDHHSEAAVEHAGNLTT